MTEEVRFGNCRAVERLASGPLTDVWHAVQEPSGLDVVVKALRPTLSPSSPFAARLAREAQILAKLRHPNVLSLHDFVQDEAAMWLVVEHVPGFTLADVLAKAARVSPLAAAAIGVEIASGLGHAHERGIVHRDVKPANVLVSRRGEVKLADFGIAQMERGPELPDVSDEGTFGTPAYMSPEQILGEPLDARSDVFSLGILLHQLVAGARPFDGDDWKTTAQRIRHDPAPPLRAIVPEVPRALERVVLRCLEKAPGDRFANGFDVAMALEAALRGATALPRSQLVTAELARVRLVPRAQTGAPEASSLVPTPRDAGPSAWATVSAYAVLLALVVSGGAVLQYGERSGEEAASRQRPAALELVPSEAGSLRVVAHPWAKVIVDGQWVDTTPSARSIPLAAGVHYVTLRHPEAPDERRVVRIAPGETVLLDVSMAIAAAAAAAPSGEPAVREADAAASD